MQRQAAEFDNLATFELDESSAESILEDRGISDERPRNIKEIDLINTSDGLKRISALP